MILQVETQLGIRSKELAELFIDYAMESNTEKEFSEKIKEDAEDLSDQFISSLYKLVKSKQALIRPKVEVKPQQSIAKAGGSENTAETARREMVAKIVKEEPSSDEDSDDEEERARKEEKRKRLEYAALFPALAAKNDDEVEKAKKAATKTDSSMESATEFTLRKNAALVEEKAAVPSSSKPPARDRSRSAEEKRTKK